MAEKYPVCKGETRELDIASTQRVGFGTRSESHRNQSRMEKKRWGVNKSPDQSMSRMRHGNRGNTWAKSVRGRSKRT